MSIRSWIFDYVLILCSLDLKRGPNYNTIIGETSTSPKCKAPVVFCIHGNKYGVVKCCDSLNEEAGASNQDNAKLTGTLNEVSDEDATSSRRNRRAPSGTAYEFCTNVPKRTSLSSHQTHIKENFDTLRLLKKHVPKYYHNPYQLSLDTAKKW